MTREDKQRYKLSRQAKARKLLIIRPLLRHFPKGYSEDIRRFVDDEVLLHSRYIFVANRDERETGYCTHCRTPVRLPDKSKHNSEMLCPNCYSACMVKHDWRGHRKLIDKTYFHYFEKSKTDPQAFVCRGIYATRNYSSEFRDVDTRFETHTFYVFQMGQTAMFTSYANYWYGMNHHGNHYEIKKTIHPRFSRYNQIKNIVLGISIDSIEKTVKDTPFQYSEWSRYYKDYNLADGFVKYFDLYAKHPCIEYIAKLGLAGIIESRIRGELTYGALNLRGKTPAEILRMKLNKTEIKTLKKNVKNIRADNLRIWQLSKKDGSNLLLEDILELNLPTEKVVRIARHTSVKKIIWYMKRQKDRRNQQDAERRDIRCTYSYGQILGDWADYIEDCKELELNLKEESVLFPKDLHQAHLNTSKQIKIQGDALLNKKIQKRLPGLESQFCFETDTLLIRPAVSSEELIQESKCLHHCVAAHYTKPYASGRTNILVIRRKAEPGRPFFTMEIDKTNRVVQTRGLKNCAMTEEVQAFVHQFTKEKIQKTRRPKTA